MANDNIQIDIIVNLQGLESIQRISGAFGRLDGAVNKTNRSQKDLTDTNWRNIRSWGDLRGHLTKVEQDLDAVWRAGVHLKALGGDLIGISRDIIGVGTGVVDMYRDYDYWLRRASVALNTNTYWSGMLDESIKDVAISVGLLKPEEVAEAFNIWGAATGVVVDDMDTLSFVTAAVKDAIIATAGAGGSLETNLKGISAILGQFNMDMSEAGHVTRVLTLMTERTQADFGDLAQAFSYVGPLAHSLGIEFDDVAQILGALADAGQRGSRAGRGLSMVIEGLSAPSAVASKALNWVVKRTHGMNAEWSKVAFPKGDFIGMNDLVIEMAKGLYSATDAQRGWVYSTAFTNNATRALIPLVERTIELWREDEDARRSRMTILEKEKYSLENAGVFFQNMTETMTGSINAVIGSFQNSFFPIIQLVAIKIMELASPVLGFLKERLQEIGDWLKANPWAVDLAVKIGAVVAAATGLAGLFFSVLGTIILLGAGIAFFVKGLSGIVFAFTLLGSVVSAVVYAIMTNIGGIRDALVRFGTEIVDLLSPARDAFNDFAVTIGDLPGILAPAFEQVMGAVADGLNFVTDLLEQINNDPTLKEFFNVLLVGVGITLAFVASIKTLGFLLGSLSSGLWAVGRSLDMVKVGGNFLLALPGPLKLVALAAGLIAGAFYAWENNVGGIRDKLQPVIDFIIANIPVAIETVSQVFNTLVTKAQELINVALPAIIGFIEQMVAWFQQAWSVLQPVLAAIWAPFDRMITYGIPALMNLLGQLWAAWEPVFRQIAEVVVGVFENNILPAIQNFIALVTENLGPLLTELAEWFRVAWDVIVTVVGGVIGTIVKVVIEFVTWIAPYVQGFLDAFLRMWGVAFEFLLSFIGGLLNTIMEVIRNVLEGIRNFIGIILAAIKGDWSGVWNGIKGLVGNIIGIIQSVIEGGLRLVGDIVNTGLKGVSAIFEFIFGEEPGSIYAKIVGFIDTVLKFGGDVIGGLVKGVGDAVGGAINSIKDFFGDIVDGVKDFLGIKSPSTLFASIGKNIVKGLWDGISGLAGWLSDKVWNWIKSVIPGPVLDALGIKSPSRVMAQIGEYIVAGLAVGIETSDAATMAMERTTSDLLSVASAGADRVNMALDNALSGSLGGVSVTSANKKTVVLQVEVTSPDGSVSQLDMAQLADLIKGPDLVSALEHMAAAD